MKQILMSAGLAAVLAGAVIGGTGAFFSDSETASGNTFAAGVIDLMVDNESYYNGNKCADVDAGEGENWQWVGQATYPVPGTPCTTSWNVSNLDVGHLFFNFLDLKPDDEGEDTISLHVDSNDAWACMDISLTSNDDNSTTEPESMVDATNTPSVWDGELAQNLEFVWWADDGDNVLEVGEGLVSDGVETLMDLASTTGAFSLALADSENNVWTGGDDTPVEGGSTAYIAKAWCLGTLTEARVAQDGQGAIGTNGPQARGTGIACEGEDLGNILQTDGATLDISFRTMQARHNPEFLCDEPEIPVVACEVGQSYIDGVVDVDQGKRKNSTLVVSDRSNPASVFGAPQSSGLPVDAVVPAGSFLSLGFATSSFATSTGEASIVLSFNDNVVVDGPGAALKLWKVTVATSPAYPDEKVSVAVSNSSVGPWLMASSSASRDASIDIAPTGLTSARYVKITNVSPASAFTDADADGYDLDAVQALNCVVSPIQ